MTKRVNIPNNPDIERSVLGACLFDHDGLEHAVATLEARDFHDPTHRAVFAALVSLAEAREEAHPLNVSSRAGIPLDKVLALMADVGTSLSIPAFARRLQAYTAARTALADLYAGIESIAKTNTPEDAVAAARAVGDRLRDMGVERGVAVPFKQMAEELWHAIDAPDQDTIGTPVPCGVGVLDRMLGGGMRPGDLIVLGARPACGKSALACNTITRNVAMAGHRVLVFSLEMSRRQLTERLASGMSGAYLSDIRGGELDTPSRVAVRDALADLAGYDGWCVDRAGMTIRDITGEAKRLNRQRKIGLVVVDYLQLIKSTGRAARREEEVSEISRELKILAKTLGCPVLALSQLNRDYEKRGVDAEPMMSDLRESGAIEQDADAIALLWGRKPMGNGSQDSEVACKLAKNRGGPTGRMRLAFDASRTTFQNTGEIVGDDDWHRQAPAARSSRVAAPRREPGHARPGV